MRISLDEAVMALRAGQVVAVPTETVYGLAAGVDQPAAIEQIFALKRRPFANPLIIHVADLSALTSYVTHYPPHFFTLAEAFWPGAVTFILPIEQARLLPLVRANLPTAAFRFPSHPLTQQLLRATGPLVMPSANLSGRPSATQVKHVEEDFGKDFPVLEGGSCEKGVESTILFYEDEEWIVLRLGALAPESFVPLLGYQPRIGQKNKSSAPLCPGHSFRHYAPRAKLLMGQEALAQAAFILGFKERLYPPDKRLILLGTLADPEEVAENLYGALRSLDEEGAETAWVDMDFPRHGLWQTLAERLLRAAERL